MPASLALAASPKRCSSSITTRPRRANCQPGHAVRADGDPDLAAADRGAERGRDGADHALDADAGASEAGAEQVQVLAGQHGGRCGDRDLAARQRDGGGGADGDLRLAETDVAADQAVHRAAGSEVFEHGVNGGALVAAQRIGKAAGDLGEPVGGRAKGGGGRCLALGRLFGQVRRGLAQLGLDLVALVPPGLAAQPVERAAALAIAPDAVELVGGDQELDAVGEFERDPVLAVHRAQAGQAADAVLQMHDGLAGAGRFVAEGQRGAGAWAEQRADRQEQEARRAQPDRHVRLEDRDPAGRRVGPALGDRRLQPALLEAAGHALGVGWGGDDDPGVAGVAHGGQHVVDPMRRRDLVVGAVGRADPFGAGGLDLRDRKVKATRLGQVAGATGDPAGLGGGRVGVVDRLADGAQAFRALPDRDRRRRRAGTRRPGPGGAGG